MLTQLPAFFGTLFLQKKRIKYHPPVVGIHRRLQFHQTNSTFLVQILVLDEFVAVVRLQLTMEQQRESIVLARVVDL
jgi:hypothetical protein